MLRFMVWSEPIVFLYFGKYHSSRRLNEFTSVDSREDSTRSTSESGDTKSDVRCFTVPHASLTRTWEVLVDSRQLTSRAPVGAA